MIKRSNRTRRNKNNHKNSTQIQLSKNINLFGKGSSAYINVTYPAFIYADSATDKYSFSGVSDIRSIAFSTITAATEFTNFATVYSNYRIHSLSFIVTPMELVTSCPILYVGLNPEAAAGNPNNSTFILRDKTHMFSPVSVSMKSVTFKVPGVGITTKIWLPVSATPAGEFLIGNNTFGGIFPSGIVVFDCQLSFLVEFNNPV